MAQDFLPDCRTRDRKGAVPHSTLGTVVPIYCGNCGTPWGMVPESLITFAFALCDPCAEKYGPIAHMYAEPDSVFWERAREAQENARIHTPEELSKALEDPSNSLSKLAAEWATHVRKEI